MNQGLARGNKRIAWLALEWFVDRNALGTMTASDEDIITMCSAAEREGWSVERIEGWLREHVTS